MFELMEQRRNILAAALVVAAIFSVAPAVRAQDDAADTAGQDSPAPAVRVVLEFGTGIDQEARALTGTASTFAAADFAGEIGQIYCLSRVQNLAPPATVTHVWYHEGKTMAKVDLNIGSQDWRTWSSKRIMQAWTGNWEVKVLDANGMVLASQEFVIQ